MRLHGYRKDFLAPRSLLAFAVALSCCVASAKEPPPSERAATEGFAVARVANNGDAPYLRLVVERDGGRNYTLETKTPVVPNPAMYGAWLPPGEYRLLRLDSSWFGFYQLPASVDLEGMFPKFSVEAGKLTDLGTLLQQPVGPLRATVVQMSDADGEGPLVRAHYPEIAAALAADPIRWNGTSNWAYRDASVSTGGGLLVSIIDRAITKANQPSMKDQWPKATSAREIVELGKRATVAMTPPVFDGGGNAFFGSALGQVLVRSPQGQWSNRDTGVADEVDAVFFEDGRLYAGTTEGRLLLSTDRGATWSTGARAPGIVTGIARLGSDFVVAVAGTPDTQALLLRGPNFLELPSVPWKVLGTARPQQRHPLRSVGLDVFGERLVAWAVPEQWFVYDAGSNAWKESAAPSADARFVNAAAGLIYSGGFRKGALSIDRGATWRELRFQGMGVGVGFRDATNGVAVVAPNRPVVVENFAVSTKDGGNTWTEVWTIPGACRSAFYLPPSDDLICMLKDGNILGSGHGADWTVERVVY